MSDPVFIRHEDLAEALHGAAALVDAGPRVDELAARLTPSVDNAVQVLDDGDLAAIAVIGHVAGRVLAEQVLPGFGSLMIPADFAAAMAPWAGSVWVVPVYASHVDDIRLELLVLPDGAGLQLKLSWRGNQPVWTGILRAPARPNPTREADSDDDTARMGHHHAPGRSRAGAD